MYVTPHSTRSVDDGAQSCPSLTQGLAVPWQIAVLVGPPCARIAMDVQSMVNSMYVLQQVPIVEIIHGRLVIQQHPVLGND